jgi:hypothetical protein
MIWNPFKKKKEPEFDPLRDLSLSKLKAGYLVDYDLKTWEVTAHHKYDWGDGFYTDEWELKSSTETLYLEREDDDEIEWALSKKTQLGKSGSEIREHLLENESPPNEILYQDKGFFLASEAAGLFLKDGKEPGIELLSWDYIDETEEEVITVEQWGEQEFEYSIGRYVEEYQFTNILPKEKMFLG